MKKQRTYYGYGKWAPKLTLDERCGFYFAAMAGEDLETITAASGLHRSSIKRLVDNNYMSYFDVKSRYKQMGHVKFGERYYSADIQQRLAAAGVALAQAGAAGRTP